VYFVGTQTVFLAALVVIYECGVVYPLGDMALAGASKGPQCSGLRASDRMAIRSMVSNLAGLLLRTSNLKFCLCNAAVNWVMANVSEVSLTSLGYQALDVQIQVLKRFGRFAFPCV